MSNFTNDLDSQPAPKPTSWLATARTQSEHLATARTQRMPPFAATRPQRRELPAVARWSIAAAIVLAVGSGAMALVARVVSQEPPRALPAPIALLVIAPPAHAAATATTPPVVVPPKRFERVRTKLAPKAIAKATPTQAPLYELPRNGPTTFEESDGSFILVAPQPKQAPLFSPNEWKRRGLQP